MNRSLEKYKALSCLSRLRILHLLLVYKDGLYVCEIVDALQVQQYNISKHLNILKMSYLVTEEKKGKRVLYRANLTDENKPFFDCILSTAGVEKNIFGKDRERLKKVLDLRANNECIIT